MEVDNIQTKETSDCPICGFEANVLLNKGQKLFYKCKQCFSIHVPSSNYLTKEEEKAIYETHNNDVLDVRYQSFVSPITHSVMKEFSLNAVGLDFGSGTGPVISYVLQKEGYSVFQYDPFFAPNKEVLNHRYDFIACCEVVEHFHNPMIEFKKLFNLLKDGGKLFVMTHLFNEEVKLSFENWYYKDDPTHVIIYNDKTMEWIAKEVGFASVSVQGRLIVFSR